MKSYLSLAWKELKAQRVTAILILIAVILSSLMTTVIGQSIGILQAMRVQQAERLNGSRYATFHQLTQQQAQVLRRSAAYRCGRCALSRQHGAWQQSEALPAGVPRRCACHVPVYRKD